MLPLASGLDKQDVGRSSYAYGILPGTGSKRERVQKTAWRTIGPRVASAKLANPLGPLLHEEFHDMLLRSSSDLCLLIPDFTKQLCWSMVRHFPREKAAAPHPKGWNHVASSWVYHVSCFVLGTYSILHQRRRFQFSFFLDTSPLGTGSILSEKPNLCSESPKVCKILHRKRASTAIVLRMF